MTSTEGDTAEKTFQVSYVISIIIIYTVTSPFTAQSNVLTIIAVKRRPRPWTNSCYLSSYILWRLFLLFDLRSSVTVKNVHCTFIAVLVMASFLYLIFVWFRESYNDQMYDTPLKRVTNNNIKIALFVVWIIALLFEVNSVLKVHLVLLP